MASVNQATRSLLILTAILAFASRSTAIEVTVTPSTITNNFAGKITLNVSGLSAGQTVRVRKFLDVNRSGTVDGPDILVENFFLTDGKIEGAGGVRNWNVPSEADGATNGEIQATIYRDPQFWPNVVAGRFLYKVADPQNAFSPVVAPLAVKQQNPGSGCRGTHP